ncbi:MAG: alpha/beta hydrolase [Gemmatimonadota bacterium]
MAGLLAIALTAAVIVGWVDYQGDLVAARVRLRGRSSTVKSPFGDIEFVESGEGPPVLVIHGSGGGYDQGELIAATVVDGGFHRIVPSRFGYLGSSRLPGATPDDQAHAYAYLLDHLRISRVAVIAMSAGGTSGLLFALLYPERVLSLTLLSCGVDPAATKDQVRAHKKGSVLVAMFKKDYRYWIVARVFRSQVMKLMGVNKVVIAPLTSGHRDLVDRMIDYMNPSSLRYAGVVFDHTHPPPGFRVAGIRAPTLVVHAEDDTIQPYAGALFAEATIPGSRLLSFPRGGHFVIGLEQPAVCRAVQQHIRDNMQSPTSPSVSRASEYLAS